MGRKDKIPLVTNDTYRESGNVQWVMNMLIYYVSYVDSILKRFSMA